MLINIVSFGGGTNSAALLIGLHKNNIPVDLITFADTGAEHPHTYHFIKVMDKWLAKRGMPTITVVKAVDRYGNRFSLETECLRSHTLPSIAYGYKRCSQKHKIAPQGGSARGLRAASIGREAGSPRTTFIPHK